MTEQRGITQPPHSAGRPFRGRRVYLDPAQIPSHVATLREDQKRWRTAPYMTCSSEGTLPRSDTDCLIIDQGNSSPRFIRLSAYSMPHASDLAATCGIPLGFSLQPFAENSSFEDSVPIVDFGEQGPPRCGKCGAYINPWCIWSGSGQVWNCNLCSTPNDVPPEYYAVLDHTGRRVDHLSRAELNKGTIDFIVPKEYHAIQPLPRLLPSFAPIPGLSNRPAGEPEIRPPEALRTLFVIDVSTPAVSSGVLGPVCESIRQALYGPSPNEATTSNAPYEVKRRQIGILTYDTSLHFYNLSPRLAQANMHVVSDIDDVFTPLLEGMFCDSVDSRNVIEGLLESIPHLFSKALIAGPVVGSAIRGGLASLAQTGGQILVFQCSLCSSGPGALKPRIESDLYGTPKEKTLFSPQDILWTELGEECAESGVAVNLFLFPSQYIDVASMGAVASTSGGDIFFHPRFDSGRDSHIVQSEVARVLGREVGYNCSIRVRASKGLHVSKYTSLLYQSASNTLTAGALSADSSITGSLTHDDSLDPRKNVHLQSAVLHTSSDGQRRVRVCNISTTVSQLAGNVFKFSDFDQGVTMLAKQAVSEMPNRSLHEIQDFYTRKFASILFGYRKNCAASTTPSQLILPESFKLLPLFGVSILKTQALKGGQVSSDTRALHYHRILSMSPSSMMTYLYPRITAIHDLSPEAALPDPSTGRLVLPAYMAATYVRMEANGAYLLDNGLVTILWIGGSVSPRILVDLFDIEEWDAVDPRLNRLPRLPNLLSIQVRNLIAHEETRRGGRVVPFMIARQNIDAAEIEFGNLLCEDENNDQMSYSEFLCHMHKDIGELLNKANTSWNPWSS